METTESSQPRTFESAKLGLDLPERIVRNVPDAPPARKPMVVPSTAPLKLEDPFLDEIDKGRAEGRRRDISQLRRALGPIVEMLKDPLVSDIHRNPDGSLWVDRVGQKTMPFPDGFRFSDDAAMQIIALVAKFMKTEISAANNPILLGSLPLDGSRFSAVVPPFSSPGPLFTIRKHAILVRTFEHYLEQRIMTRDQVQFLRKRINARDNFLIVGATKSGKTTFANALLREAAESSTPDDRFIIIEDTRELQCPAPNHVFLVSDEQRGVDMNRLLATTLRLSPSRICVGELRGKEAATYIEACNTGHEGGLATIHSSSVESGLIRLETLIRKAGIAPNKVEISKAIQTVVAIEYLPDLGLRRVTGIKRITGATEREYYFAER